jgi:hypothetical protein
MSLDGREAGTLLTDLVHRRKPARFGPARKRIAASPKASRKTVAGPGSGPRPVRCADRANTPTARSERCGTRWAGAPWRPGARWLSESKTHQAFPAARWGALRSTHPTTCPGLSLSGRRQARREGGRCRARETRRRRSRRGMRPARIPSEWSSRPAPLTAWSPTTPRSSYR